MKMEEFDFGKALDFFAENYERYGFTALCADKETPSAFSIPLSQSFTDALIIASKENENPFGIQKKSSFTISCNKIDESNAFECSRYLTEAA